jgi:hypothetical protein
VIALNAALETLDSLGFIKVPAFSDDLFRIRPTSNVRQSSLRASLPIMQKKRVLRLFGVSAFSNAAGDVRYFIESHGGKIETSGWIRC